MRRIRGSHGSRLSRGFRGERCEPGSPARRRRTEPMGVGCRTRSGPRRAAPPSLATNRPAAIFLPRGLGTLLEITWIAESIAKGHVSPRPLVFLGVFWRRTVALAVAEAVGPGASSLASSIRFVALSKLRSTKRRKAVESSFSSRRRDHAHAHFDGDADSDSGDAGKAADEHTEANVHTLPSRPSRPVLERRAAQSLNDEPPSP